MNTRFNPTVNGRLHVGHLYLVLLNYRAAKDSGGRFIVRFDDDQVYWREAVGDDGMARYAEAVKEDLEWLGLTPDAYTSERESRQLNEEFIVGRLPHPETILSDRGDEANLYQIRLKSQPALYPYAPYLTSVKVAQDHREGIDTLIRGDDLIPEFSLYCYLCDLASVAKPWFHYVPRMMANSGFGGPTDLTNVSKTRGGCQIAEYRDAGWTPQELTEMVAESALLDPVGEWVSQNVKRQPIVRRMP